MPSGKGSSVVQADGLYKLLMKEAPGRINQETADTVLVAAVAMEIPMVHKVDPEFFSELRTGFRTYGCDKRVITVKAELN